jgi:DNA-binding NtrC family response regulator
LFNTSNAGAVYASPSEISDGLQMNAAVAQAPARKIGKKSTILEARINSLKVLALTLLREVEYLEEQNATGAPEALDLQTEVHRFEAEMIRSALIRTGGRQRRAARLLGMKTTTLNSKIRRYQIDKKET